MLLYKELYKIRVLLLLEIIILIISAIFDFYPFYVFFGLIFILILAYYSYHNPVIINFILMLSILIDALIYKETKSNIPSILITEFFLLFFSLIILLKLFDNFEVLRKDSDFIIIWLPFLVWSLVIGLIIGVDKFRILSYWKNYFAGFFIFFVTYYMINKSHVKFLVLSLILWGLLLSFIEMKIFLEMGGLAKGLLGLIFKKNLLTVGWGKSNYVAAFFVIIIPITIGYLLYVKSRIGKLFLFLIILFMLLGIIITLSRGGIIALIIALCLLVLKTIRPRFLIPIFSLLFVIVLFIALNPLTYVLIERISNLESSFSVYSRINYYKDVWRAFLEHPFSGVGFGNLSYYSKFILGPDLSPSAHNIILGALGELGIFGASFFLMIFYLLIKRSYYNYKTETDRELKILKWSFFSAIIGGLIHSLVEPTFEGLQFSIVYWTIAAITLKL